MSSIKHKKQTELGFFYKLLQILNGLIFILLIIFYIHVQIIISGIPDGTENAPALAFGIIFIQIMLFILLPLSVINLIYFLHILFKKNISKAQRIICISILVFSAIILLIGLNDFILPLVFGIVLPIPGMD